jgi:uncharacterized protein (DUF305 family)
MRLTKPLMIAITGLGIATTSVLAMPHFSDSLAQRPWRREGMTGWQMPMHRGHMMQNMQASNEVEFLSLMIPHHQEAIATALLLLQYSERPEMKTFAKNIIEVQSAEIEQMQSWLDEWYSGQQSQLTYTPMMRDLTQLQGDELDQAFLEDMIMHHMGAVMMSQMLVHRGLVEHQAVQPFAQNIANNQRQEIWQMRDWLTQWYDTAGMPCMIHRAW